MTNQPDESHPLRDRVDEAISWFTQTDEPPEPPSAPVTPSRPVEDESAPVADDQSAPVADDQSAPVDEVSSIVEDSVEDNSAPRVEDNTTTGTNAPTPVTEAASDAWTPDPRVASPVAADIPGNQAAPVELAPEPRPEPLAAPASVFAPHPVTPVVADVAPERVYAADEFSTHPVGVSGVSAEAWPVNIAPERVVEADEFVPVNAAPVPPVGVAPATIGVEGSDVAEPTSIHPIEPPSSWAEVHPDAQGLSADEVENASAAEVASQRAMFRDEAPTVALPLGAAAAASAIPAVEQTAVLDAQEAARVRREERASRDRQLGKVIASADDTDEPLVTPFKPPTTYNGLPSFGLLVLRLVIAAVVGIRAWQQITHLSATRDMWAATVVPNPGVVAWTQIGLEIAIAVLLIIGLGTRIVGGVLLLLSVALLAFVQWGAVSPFQPGAADFIGVVDVLLAGVGFLFATIGGGRIAFDGGIHIGRIRRKNDKLFA